MNTAVDPVLRRIHLFERAIHAKSARRVVPLAWGTAYFNDRLPKVFDLNLIRVHHEIDDQLPANALISEAERLQAGADLGHRRVYLEDEAAGEHVNEGFLRAGWEATRFLFMAHEQQSDRAIDGADVREVEWEVLRPLRLEMMRRERWATSEDEARQVCDSTLEVARAVAVRFFIAYERGVAASSCCLYSDGRTAQIEDVGTLEEFRGRGLARSVVWAALQESLGAGHDLTFLVADDDDTPKELYRKLGFVDTGRAYCFTRLPEGHPSLRSG